MLDSQHRERLDPVTSAHQHPKCSTEGCTYSATVVCFQHYGSESVSYFCLLHQREANLFYFSTRLDCCQVAREARRSNEAAWEGLKQAKAAQAHIKVVKVRRKLPGRE